MLYICTYTDSHTLYIYIFVCLCRFNPTEAPRRARPDRSLKTRRMINSIYLHTYTFFRMHTYMYIYIYWSIHIYLLVPTRRQISRPGPMVTATASRSLACIPVWCVSLFLSWSRGSVLDRYLGLFWHQCIKIGGPCSCSVYISVGEYADLLWMHM